MGRCYSQKTNWYITSDLNEEQSNENPTALISWRWLLVYDEMTTWIRAGVWQQCQVPGWLQSYRSETQDTQSENCDQMPFSFVRAAPPRFLHCCNSSPSVSENRMCPSFFRGSSIMSKPTLFVTILNSCGLNQSSSPFSKWNRQHRRSRLFYTTLYCSNALIFCFSLFLLPPFLLALQWCQILSSFALSTTLFSPPD